MNWDHPNDSIVEIGQNTGTSPEETCCNSDFSERLSAHKK